MNLLIAGLQMSPFRADREQAIACSKKYLSNVKAFDPQGIERVRGMADGAGISFDEAFAIHCYMELIINFPHLAGMCTSFAATGPATENGITMLGQNIDWHPDTPLDLLRIRHEDGPEQIAVAFFGMPCCILSSRGFGNCANLTLSPMGPVTSHVPFSFYLFKAMVRNPLKMPLISCATRQGGLNTIIWPMPGETFWESRAYMTDIRSWHLKRASLSTPITTRPLNMRKMTVRTLIFPIRFTGHSACAA